MSTTLTPMLEQYHRIKRQHRDAILMFRMGDFYEMFFEDAVDASGVLEIALTSRGKGTANEAPMCGVPHHSVDSYIARLIASGRKVAVCDQVEDASKAKGLVRREVVRVVSPGTAVDPASLGTADNLYIACVLPAAEGVGAAFIDLSTGDFQVAEGHGPGAWEEIAVPVATFRPREVLHPEEFEPDSLPVRGMTDGATFGSLASWSFGRDTARETLTRHLGTRGLEGFGVDEMDLALRAGGALLQHLKATQRSDLDHIRRVVPHHLSDHLVMDAPTLRTLEITRSIAGGGRRGSLLSVIDKTLTAMGARRLQSWLLSPPLRLDRIEARLDAVEELSGDLTSRETLRLLLKGIRDIERLVGRVSLGRANARDLVALRESLAPLPDLDRLVSSLRAPLLTGHGGAAASSDTAAPPGRLDVLEDVHGLLGRALVDDPPLALQEGGLIRDGHDSRLDELRAISRDGKSYIASIETRERKRTGIQTLKVRYNRVFGYFIEVSKSNLDLVPADYDRKQTLVNAERFVTPELKEYEEKVLTAQDRMHEIEYEIFCRVRDEVARRAGRLQEVAGRIADLDALASLAEVAAVRGYTRPRVVEGARTRIVGGRHPVVETANRDERFVPNDADFGGPSSRILIVTGPNMGGKSTYLRQVALITLMAQAGSFVPAEEAEIGIVDRVFSRIGSSDNLAGGQSTFMVEMQETANILHNATSRSLVLLDEVGRGTSTFDGLSLAWAIVEYLHDAAGGSPRVLFATHYHELTELSLTLDGVHNLTVAVKEAGNDVIFLRKIEPGAADRSYGIQVARLAGIPVPVIERAREVLANLESNELGRDGLPKLARHARGDRPAAGQLPLFGAPEDPAAAEIAEELRGTEIERITPLEALLLLDRLKKKL